MARPNRSYPTLTPLTTLPTSPSYLHPTPSIPPTPSLLSRPSSQTRLRPSRSTPTPIPPTTTTSSSSSASASSAVPAPKKTRAIRNANNVEDDWVTRTASTLALTRLEEKGQAWLAARDSSTSLTGAEEGEEDDDGFGAGCAKGWGRERVRLARGSSGKLQGLSRGQSRAQSRRGSVGVGGGVRGHEEEEEEGEIGPDFVDVEEEGEEEGEEVDEGELKRVVMGRVGGWVDWAVGWMDFRGEGEEEEGDADADGAEGGAKEDGGEIIVRGELDLVELQKRLRKKKKDDEAEAGGEGTNTMSSAPEEAGVWADAKWLLVVATKVAL